MSPALRTHFADYAAYHATPGNQACHYVGIPVIVFAVVALLARVPLGEALGVDWTLAEPVVATVVLYYLTLDVPLALAMLLASALSAAAGRHVPALASLVLFGAGWVLQFVGHYAFEKRSPAFLHNLAHLLVGPLWILAKATGRR
jgi:uncharacterized membrane protein YGL010W